MVARKANFVVTRSEGGEQDPDTGVYQPDESITVYDSSVTWQEGVSGRRTQHIETQLGISVEDVEFTLFLTLQDKISDLRLNDTGVLTLPDGAEYRVRIIGIRKLDSSVYVDRYE